MRKSQPVIYHGLLKDHIIFSGLIYMSANKRTFLGEPRKVVNVKSISRGKSLTKIKRSSQRHR